MTRVSIAAKTRGEDREVSFTGDPFVDMGALVMATMPQKSVEEKLQFVTADVYVNLWKAKLHAVFLHSKLTHISLTGKPEAQRKGSLDYYLGLLQEKEKTAEGFCRVCAHDGPLFSAERKNFPLVGSGEFTNFHHLHEPGLLLCKNCLIRLYFLPLGLLQGGGNLMMLQVQNGVTRRFWQELVVHQNLDKISRGSSEGILNTGYTRAQNALFGLASELIRRLELYEAQAQRLRLFCFSNFGATPEVAIYDLPNNVFSFLQRVMRPDLRPDWIYFVRKYYWFKKTGFHFDPSTGDWYEIKKNDKIRIEEQEYGGTRTNTVYDRLLAGKSILGMIRAVHKQRTFPIHITIAYLREVRNMRQEKISLIKKISERIILLSEKTGREYKYYLTKIEGAKYSYQLRRTVIQMAKDYLKNNEKEPFIRFNDYVEYLFPDDQSWYEVRDLLLICLYEKLHELNVEPSDISDEPIAEIEVTQSDSIESHF